MKKLSSALPGLLRSGLGNVMPNLVSNAFSAAGELIGNIVAMLPELIPALGEGLLNLFSAALGGLSDVLDGLFTGVHKAMVKIGADLPYISEAVQGMIDSVDQAEIDDIIANANVNFNTTVSLDDYQAKIDGAVSEIRTALEGIPELSAAQKTKIEAAILSGSGLDMLQLAFDSIGINASAAIASITTAQDSINVILADLGLSPEAQAHIQSLIANNASSSEIQAAIESFGVNSGAASAAVSGINGAMDTLDSTLAGLGLDPSTIPLLCAGLFVDRCQVVAALQLLGLDDTAIAAVMSSYDTVAGSLGAKIRGVYTQIAQTFTDGVPETDEEVQAAKAAIEGVAAETQARIDKWYQDKVTELQSSGLTGTELETKLSETQQQYDSMSASLTEATQTALGITESMVGQSKAYCEGQLVLMQSALGTMEDIAAQVDTMTNPQREHAQVSRTLTIAGVTNDKSTQFEAIALTYQEYSDMVRAAEEEYAASIEEARKTMSGEEYAAAEREARAKLEAARQDAANYYQSYMQQILAGIAQSDPVLAGKINEVVSQKGMADAMMQLNNAIANALPQDGSAIGMSPEEFLAQNGFTTADVQAWADALGMEYDDLWMQISNAMQGGDEWKAFSDTANGFSIGVEENIRSMLASGEIDLSSVVPALAAGIQEGYLIPGINGVDYTSGGDLFNELLAGSLAISPEVSGAAVSAAEETGAQVAEATNVSDEMRTAGANSGQGFINGLRPKLNAAIQLARQKAAAIANAIRSALKINSPSRVMEELGSFTGEGYDVGLQKSMATAVRTAKMMSGQIVTSADFTQTMRVNIPNLNQEIRLANEQSSVPIYLNVNGRTLASVTAGDTRRAQNSYNRSIALGVGK